MPKIQIGAMPKHYNNYLKTKNCGPLIHKVSVLVDDYMTLLSFHDKQQLLYIARMIEKNHKKLPDYRYESYECKLNELMHQYTKQGR